MSLYVSDSGARAGTYNENVGIDIDGEIVSSAPGGGDYYDYDLLTRPNVGVSGSGIIISPPDGGFPSVDDYVVNPDGSKARVGMEDVLYKKDFLSVDQS